MKSTSKSIISEATPGNYVLREFNRNPIAPKKSKFKFPVVTSLSRVGKKPTLKDRKVAESARRRIRYLDAYDKFRTRFEEKEGCIVHGNITDLNIRKSRNA